VRPSPPVQVGSPGAPRRRLRGAASVATALALLLGGTLAAAARAEEFTNELPINAPGLGTATPYPSAITVSELTGAITDVNVKLIDLHTNESDNVAMLLMGPNGQSLLLADGAGGGPTDAGGAQVIFDDSSPFAIPDDLPISHGAYKPTAEYSDTSFPSPGPGTSYQHPGPDGGNSATLASTFNGGAPNGEWGLYLLSLVIGTSASIDHGWTLEITSAAPSSGGGSSPPSPGAGPTSTPKKKKCKKGKKKRAAVAVKKRCKKRK
jgi:hypothetical protein